MNSQNSPEVIAEQIIELARNELLVNFRFLDRALLTLTPRPSTDVSFLTDGATLTFDPWFVIQRYKEDENALARSYLHAILHLVLRHSYVDPSVDRKLWSLACDIAVEVLLRDFHGSFLVTKQSHAQESFLATLRSAMGDLPLTAERILDYLEKQTFSEETWDELTLLFWGDSHALWYEEDNGNVSEDIDLRIRWEEISKRMQIELETMQKDQASLLATQLRLIHRTRQNYGQLLRKFSRSQEVLKVSDEEFDYNYYTYGLHLYGDMPIVEPLEYSQRHRIRDFVIALDTSGSIREEVAEKFLDHTYRILSSEDSFDQRARLHILQCDDRIRSDIVIHNEEEMKDYLSHFSIFGRGETDFRPVFRYVEQLQKGGELRELRGLIYFTDGEGIFPEQAPSWDTAFVLHRDAMYAPVPVPSWAIRAELEDEDILHGKL